MDKVKLLKFVIELLKWLVAILSSYIAGANNLLSNF